MKAEIKAWQKTKEKTSALNRRGWNLELMSAYLNGNPEQISQYRNARRLEEEGKSLQQNGNRSFAKAKYQMALNIFQSLGLNGECMRVATRMGDEVLARRYVNQIKAGWEETIEK